MTVAWSRQMISVVAGSAKAEVEPAAAVAEADLSVAGRRCRNARTRGSGPAGASVAHVRTTGHEEGMALLDDFVAALDLAARDHGLVTRPQLVAERLSSSSIARLANTRRALRPLGGGCTSSPPWRICGSVTCGRRCNVWIRNGGSSR